MIEPQEGQRLVSKKFHKPRPLSKPQTQIPAAQPVGLGTMTNQTIISQLNVADARAQITAIEQARGSRVICLTYNVEGPGACNIAPAVVFALQQALTQMGHVPKLDLVLRTTGGAAEVPWRIVSLLREFSDSLGVIVSGFALSGGCHIAIGADDLVMGPFSMLGPVDPTRNHPLLPRDAVKNEPIPTSVQDLKHCIQFIREQLGESYPQQNLAQIVSELFKYINPLALGALEQTYNLSRLITRKVLGTHKTALPDEQITKIVDVLSGQYYSHAFLISRDDVEKDLGLKVTRPAQTLLNAMGGFEATCIAEFEKGVTAAPGIQEPLVYVGSLLQTTDLGMVLAILKNKDGTVVGEPWIKFR